jgi:hypothetical protein
METGRKYHLLNEREDLLRESSNFRGIQKNKKYVISYSNSATKYSNQFRGNYEPFEKPGKHELKSLPRVANSKEWKNFTGN